MIEPLPVAPPVAAFREIGEVDHDPFAGVSSPLVAGETAPASASAGTALAPVPPVLEGVVEAPTDIRKEGQVARQVEDMLWQAARAHRDPDFEEWTYLPQVIKAAATKMARGAARMGKQSPREFVEQQTQEAARQVAGVYTRFQEETAKRETERIAQAEATSRQTAAEAKVSGRPEERARSSKKTEKAPIVPLCVDTTGQEGDGQARG